LPDRAASGSHVHADYSYGERSHGTGVGAERGTRSDLKPDKTDG